MIRSLGCVRLVALMSLAAGCGGISLSPDGAGGSGGGAGGSTGATCGSVTCPGDQVCCNASCGICAPPGGACTQMACLPPDGGTGGAGGSTGAACGKVTCPAGQVCCNESCGICTSPTGACTQQFCSNGLKYWFTCGDPVCRVDGNGGADGGVPTCTAAQTAGASCTQDGLTCDPGDSCGRKLVCAASDPTHGGNCPISRRAFKRDVAYLAPDDLARYRDELLSLKLATWRYKQDPAARLHLGFMIDDSEGSVAVDGARDMVDLYAYTSMAVATLQLQAREIAELRREVARLKKAARR